MVGTTAVTSGLGFIYWWLAARTFPAEAVGLASAAVSAMLLMGSVSVFGFGTLLIGELPRQPDKPVSLVVTALLIVGVAGGILGILFAMTAPWISPDLRALASAGSAAIFALGASLTSITLVLDQAIIGLLHGELQLGRNTLFALSKLGALLAAGLWLPSKPGLAIYVAWTLGNLISLFGLAGLAATRGIRISDCRPQWGILRRLGRAALGHHALNLALQAPSLMLPVVVTALLSARMNAYFYAAWMIAYFIFAGSVALTTVLYAVGAAEPAALMHKIRATLKLSLMIGLLANGVLLLGANLVLSLFGHVYAEQAGWSLRLLGLAVFPLIVKNHYVAICRIRGRTTGVALFMAVGGLLELALVALGAKSGGLTGLSLGWLVAICVEAAFMAGTVYRLAVPANELKQEQTNEAAVPSLGRSGG
jgi:O-antigen/teichoic acid export membrane protein